jgi:hypothetical protein
MKSHTKHFWKVALAKSILPRAKGLNHPRKSEIAKKMVEATEGYDINLGKSAK